MFDAWLLDCWCCFLVGVSLIVVLWCLLLNYCGVLTDLIARVALFIALWICSDELIVLGLFWFVLRCWFVWCCVKLCWLITAGCIHLHLFCVCGGFPVWLFGCFACVLLCVVSLLIVLYGLWVIYCLPGVVYCRLDLRFLLRACGLWLLCCLLYWDVVVWGDTCFGWLTWCIVGFVLLGLFTPICLIVVNFLDYFVVYILGWCGWLLLVYLFRVLILISV